MNPIQNSITTSTSGSTQKADLGVKRGGVGASKSSGAGAAGVQAGGDMVSISNSARLLNTASTMTTSGVSNQRINALKAAIASGQYTVDPQKIAKGLVQDSQALLKATTGG
ncbi:flagellar biosynthesis anti-sigma factor FlgM [Thiomonas sp. FB-Cd]|uniref:flagellar biosynthesis anti-sigma factor FlgM n=1 Tax=Thiomonas sp. FB-Cd TaxID=1158292 RepID=UPI0004DF847C|nr:flagellar biosynthesis anti-sigma factor FlgM [Thiomonas sp. FB-Cd]